MEASGEGDPRHAEIGFLQETLGGEQAVRLRDLDRRGAEHTQHHAPEMAVRDAQIAGEILQPLFFESARLDALHRIMGEALGGVDGRGAGGELGPAPEARTEARLLGRSGGGVEGAILPFRGPRRAYAAAIDAGGRDADEEEPVIAAVLGLGGGVADGFVDQHEANMGRSAAPVSPKSDI